MQNFLDADLLLSKLRNNEIVLTEEAHLISFDEKISNEDLQEIEHRCVELGYTFDGVKIYKSKNGKTFFAYDMTRSK
jgi:hypothetical protein